MKKCVPINDGWLFKAGFDRGCLDESFGFEGFMPVSLPHCAAAPIESYDGASESAVATYTRILALSEDYDRSRLMLCFGGVVSYVEVYVNGIFVTSHRGDVPFEADVSAPLRVGFENRIILRVDSRAKLDVPLTAGVSPVPPYCGIHRGVALKAVSGGEIADAHVRTLFSDDNGAIDIDVTLGEYYPDSRISAEIYDAGGEKLASLPEKAVLGGMVTLTGIISDVKLWSTESPTLYTAVVGLRYGRHLVDVKEIAFGFRRAEFTRGGFYLNGSKIRLIGLNRADDYPVLGRAVTDGLQRYDARKLKELGVNIVRTHGLAAESFMDECDRIGLMVIADIGGDGYIGDSSWKETFISEIETVVRTERNHPSVIAWGVRANSSPDCDELYFKTCKAAHDLDPTRPALGTRDFMASRLYEDVFAYSDYRADGKVTRRRKTGRLSVPYFISEHTGRALPTKRYDGESRRTEQARRHLKFMDAAFSSEGLCGCAGMAFADFSCLSDLGSGDGRMYYGVLDAYRIDKTAAFAYRSQTDGEPYLECSSALEKDEVDLPLTFYTNCDSVKLYRDSFLVGEFFPNRKDYPALKHPPVEIDDLVGDAPKESDKLTGKANALLKYVARAARKKGTVRGLPVTAQIAAFVLRRMSRLGKDTFYALVEKYAFSPAVYDAEGIKDGQIVVKKRLTSTTHEAKLEMKASALTLTPRDTYETVLVTVESKDENGRTLPYDFSPIKIDVEGELTLVGSDFLSLEGGAVGFYLTTTPYDGAARVSVMSRHGRASLDLEVIHERVEEL
ncbi:MAG: hypothetical protein HFK09_06750 [Clostridia bacterium]|nr:hypothetical protein [Clostridia bacterium]